MTKFRFKITGNKNLMIKKNIFILSIIEMLTRVSVVLNSDSKLIESVDKSSRSHMFFKVSVLKNFANFTVQHLRWDLFLVKLQTCKFIKKKLQHRCCPLKFLKIVRKPFL